MAPLTERARDPIRVTAVAGAVPALGASADRARSSPRGRRRSARRSATAPTEVVDLYLTDEAATRHADIVAARRAPTRLPLHEVTDEVLAAMVRHPDPAGARWPSAAIPEPTLDEVLAAAPRLLVLLSQRARPRQRRHGHPGADAAGADAVLVSDACVDVYAPKVVRSTAGSLFHLPVVTGLPVEATVDRLRAAGITRARGRRRRRRTVLPDVDLRPAARLGDGQRGVGPAPEDRALAATTSVRVPIHGRAESLNLAMAATVCLYASAGSTVEPLTVARHGPSRAVGMDVPDGRDEPAAGVAAELIPDGLVAVDGEGSIVFFNARADPHHGRPPRGDRRAAASARSVDLHDSDGTSWWDVTDPWNGLRHPHRAPREAALHRDSGREVLVTAKYLRRRRKGPVNRVAHVDARRARTAAAPRPSTPR